MRVVTHKKSSYWWMAVASAIVLHAIVLGFGWWLAVNNSAKPVMIQPTSESAGIVLSLNSTARQTEMSTLAAAEVEAKARAEAARIAREAKLAAELAAELAEQKQARQLVEQQAAEAQLAAEQARQLARQQAEAERTKAEQAKRAREKSRQERAKQERVRQAALREANGKEKTKLQQEQAKQAAAASSETANSSSDNVATGTDRQPVNAPPTSTAGGVNTNPTYRKRVMPTYPKRALNRGVEGVVVVDAKIDTAGRVTTAAVHTSSGNRLLDRAALKAVNQSVFEPAIQNGRAVTSTVRAPIRFRIN